MQTADALERAIENAEGKFAEKHHINDVQYDTNIRTRMCVTIPSFPAIASALQECEQTGSCTTRLLSPRNTPRGMAVLLELKHQNEFARMSKEGVQTSTHLFRITHALKNHGSGTGIFIEGPPYESTMPQDSNLMVPGTRVPVFSVEGQGLLLQNPQLLAALLQEKNWTFERALMTAEFGQMHGIESPASHSQTLQDLRTHFRHIKLDQQTGLIINALLAGQVGFTQTSPRNAVYEGKPYPLPDIIAKCRNYRDAIRALYAMHDRRENEAITRIEETMSQQDVAKLC